MEYSDDNLARIRAALLDYHAATRSNGRKRSWSDIARTIADEFAELMPSAEDDADDLWSENSSAVKDPHKPLAEALRRFAAGTQTPSEERLDATCGYLKAKKFLTDADLLPAESGQPLLHALTAFFGAGQGPSDRAIEGRFTASRKQEGRPIELSVLTVRANGSGAAIAEDRLYNLPIAPQSTQRDALVRLLSRTGGSEQRFDGWLFVVDGPACLVVRDTLRGEASIYTIVGGGSESELVHLVKSRDFGLTPVGYNRAALRFAQEPQQPRERAIDRIKERMWEYRKESGDEQ